MGGQVKSELNGNIEMKDGIALTVRYRVVVFVSTCLFVCLCMVNVGSERDGFEGSISMV